MNVNVSLLPKSNAELFLIYKIKLLQLFKTACCYKFTIRNVS